VDVTSNLGRWAPWYQGLDDRPAPYCDTDTYRQAADWLADCATVEDWGCGKGWFRQFTPGAYLGVDGTASPFADVVADLVTYQSDPRPEGILLRHVIEHEPRWAELLDNALASFTRRLCLIVFTPLAAETHQIAWLDELGVPDISFAVADLTARFDAAGVIAHPELDIPSTAAYGVEHVIRIARG
jgi:hypothetical protein